MASKITVADVETNRRRNLQATEEEQKELLGYMKPKFHGLLTAEEYEEFEAYRSEFYNYMLNLDSLKALKSVQVSLKELLDYIAEIMVYTGPVIFLSLFKHYCKNPTEKQTEQAHFYAWVLLFAHGLYFPLDDLIDRTVTRRFKPAYFVQVGSSEVSTMQFLLGFQALSEAVALKFKNEPFGYQLTRRFEHYNVMGTAAQTYEVQSLRSQESMFWDLTFRDIHLYNDSMITPLLNPPLETAALMTGHHVTPEQWNFWHSTMMAVHKLMRFMNDFNDVYPAAPTGKLLYTDIINGAATWCSVKCWELANEEQRQILKENYGSEDLEKIAKVLQVFQDVDLRAQFLVDRKEAAKEVLLWFEQCPEDLVPKQLFLELYDFATEEHGLVWH